MIRAKFTTFCFDRSAREQVLNAVTTEWPEGAHVDVLRLVSSLSVLYPKAVGVRVDFMLDK